MFGQFGVVVDGALVAAGVVVLAATVEALVAAVVDAVVAA
jgi:hypothetical protein